MHLIFLSLVLAGLPTPACRVQRNLALNPERHGFPSPLESDPGWGGGANAWEIVDGRTSYENWAHGLAFTGGHTTSAGGSGYGAEPGVRQATVDFGRARRVERVMVWNHGAEHTPKDATLEAWVGEHWVPLRASRKLNVATAEGREAGSSAADSFSFAPVLTSKIRYSFDNRLENINGTWNVHGWLYELEVFGCDP